MCISFLRPGYPEKNPLSQKMELIQAGIWILADNIKSREIIPGLSIGSEHESQNPLKTRGNCP